MFRPTHDSYALRTLWTIPYVRDGNAIFKLSLTAADSTLHISLHKKSMNSNSQSNRLIGANNLFGNVKENVNPKYKDKISIKISLLPTKVLFHNSFHTR